MKFKGIIPEEVIDSIKKNKCVLFVGSGISASVKRTNNKNLPTWHNFLIELLEFGISKNVMFWNGHEEIREIIEKGNYLLAAEELQECIPMGEFSEFLNVVFRDRKVKPTKLHKKISSIPFRSILTSNYDTLIEGGYTIENGGRIPIKFIQEDLQSISSPLRKEDFFIFKIHGDIDKPESIILGSRAYNKLLFRSPEYLSFLQTLFTTHTILFAGFGGSDIDLDFIIDRLSTIYARTLHKHFILLPDKKYNLTEKRRLLKDKRIEVIDYVVDKSHSQVSAFFDDISSIVNENIGLVPEEDTKTISSIDLLSSRKFKEFLSTGEEGMQGIDYVHEKLNVNSWYWGIKEESDPKSVFIIDSDFPLVIILDDEFMESKILESLFELILIRESENNRIILVYIVEDVFLPPIIATRFLFRRLKLTDREEMVNLIYSDLKSRKIL